MKTFNDLPFELIKMISADLPAQAYLNFRECCRNTAKLNRVARLHFKAYQESVKGWTAENGRTFEALYSCTPPSSKSDLDRLCDENVHLKVQEYSLSSFNWLCKNFVGDQAMRMIRFDPTVLANTLLDHKTFSFQWACKFGNFDIVQLLLQDPRVDASARENLAIRIASKIGHTDIVKLLLQDSRVDASARDNSALGWASKNGHTDIVQILLQDPRVDPSAVVL